MSFRHASCAILARIRTRFPLTKKNYSHKFLAYLRRPNLSTETPKTRTPVNQYLVLPMSFHTPSGRKQRVFAQELRPLHRCNDFPAQSPRKNNTRRAGGLIFLRYVRRWNNVPRTRVRPSPWQLRIAGRHWRIASAEDTGSRTIERSSAISITRPDIARAFEVRDDSTGFMT